MAGYKQTLLISLLIHAALLFLAVILLRPSMVKQKTIKVNIDLQEIENFEELKPVINQQIKQILPSDHPQQPGLSDLPEKEPETRSNMQNLQRDSISLRRNKYTGIIQKLPKKKSNVTLKFTQDSLLIIQKKSWQKTIKSFLNLEPPVNEITEMIKKQNDGSAKIFFTPQNITNKKKKKYKIQYNFIPTAAEIHTIAFLFKSEKKKSQLDLYANLDSTIITTAENFDRSLNHLIKKGFLNRKKVSPQNIMMFVTPVGGVPVEMSAKNRKNPVFEYELKVSKDKLIDYLHSCLFKLQLKLNTSPSDTTAIKKKIKDIEQKIGILL